jgi:hypothetical protein
MPGITGTASAASGAPANSLYYGRIFPDLAPFASVSSTVTDALMAVGQRGGSWMPVTISPRVPWH